MATHIPFVRGERSSRKQSGDNLLEENEHYKGNVDSICQRRKEYYESNVDSIYQRRMSTIKAMWIPFARGE
jgi:hypothetical protein